MISQKNNKFCNNKDNKSAINSAFIVLEFGNINNIPMFN